MASLSSADVGQAPMYTPPSPGRPEKRRRTSHDLTGPYWGVLREGGLRRIQNRDGFLCDQPSRLAYFLESKLCHDPRGLKAFLEGLTTHIRGDITQALQPLAAASSRSNMDDYSLIRTLLQVASIQPVLITMLLEKLPELAQEMDEPEYTSGGGSPMDLPRTLLQQLRWIDHLVDSGALTAKLLECLTVLPLPLQRELISYLPEVVEDAHQAEVVEGLRELQASEPRLLVCMLDAYSSLSLPPSVLGGITQDVLGQLDSAEHSVLPVLVRFLIESATADNMTEVIDELRNKLQLSSVESGATEDEDGTRIEGQQPQQDNDSLSSHDALTLDALRRSLEFRSDVAGSFLKVIAEASRCTPVDLWVLLSLLVCPATRSKALALYKRKAGSGQLDEGLLQDAVNGLAGALQGLFPQLLEVAGELVRCSNRKARAHGQALYVCLFKEFKAQLYHQQEVVAELIAHVGGTDSARNEGGEVTCALGVLHQLAEEEAAGLRTFDAFLKGMLDYLHQGLTHAQVRSVFRILCAALVNIDEVHIFIRKYISHAQLELKYIGIIGAVAFAITRGRMTQDEREPEAAAIDASKSALRMAVNHCRNSHLASKFFYDELADAVADVQGQGKLSKTLTLWLTDLVSEPFTTGYFTDLDKGKLPPEQETCGSGSPLACELAMGLDGEEAAIALNLLPLLAPSSGQVTDDMKGASMGPMLRLLAACELEANGSLKGIDAVLGCPLVMPCSADIDDIEGLPLQAQEAILSCYMWALHWCRELVNAFAADPEPTSAAKVVRRLGCLIKLEDDLLFMLKRCTWYRFQGVAVVQEKTKSRPAANTEKSKSSLKGKGKGKAPAAKATKLPDGESIRQSLRALTTPLSPEAVTVLGFQDMRCAARNTEGNTLSSELVLPRADLAVVRLLLQELHAQLAAAFPQKKFPPFQKAKALTVDQHHKRSPGDLIMLLIQGKVFDHVNELLGLIGRGLSASSPDVEELYNSDLLLPCCEVVLQVMECLCCSEEIPMEMLKAVLSGVAGKAADNPFVSTFEMLKALAPLVQQLSMAVKLVTVLEALTNARARSGDEEDELMEEQSESGLEDDAPATLGQQLSDLSLELLQRDWASTSSSPKFQYTASTLGMLVRCYLENAENGSKAIGELVHGVMGQLLLTENCLGPVEEYPTLTSASFVHYLTPAMKAVTLQWKELSLDDDADILPTLLRMASLTNAFSTMLDFTKGNVALTRGKVLLTALRHGRKFVEAFLSAPSIKFLEKTFKQHQNQVLKIIESLQVGTRQLHIICSHGKRQKDKALSNEAPAVRKQLETFIYRIKAITQANDCVGAMWVGNLKNKDLNGTVLKEEDLLYQEDENSSDYDESEESSDEDEEVEAEGEEETEE